MMGRVAAAATIESLRDLYDARDGRLLPDQVRRVTVADAIVSTETMLLSLPTDMIRRLGLAQTASKHVLNSGERAVLYDPVRLTIQGRSCTMDVLEVPDGVPVLIGQIPLEHLDLVVDPRNRTLVGNPAHGGEHVYEMY
jgi:hypothetical protein